MIGAGPYRLASWERERGFTLERNEHYWGPRPAIGRVRFEIVPDAEDRIARLLSGRVDVVDEVPLERVDALRAEKAIRVFAGPSLRVLFLTLRVTEPPFSDPRVREAVDLALDRDELVARAYDGKTVTASQLVPASVVGFNPDLRNRAATGSAPAPCSRRPAFRTASTSVSTGRTTGTSTTFESSARWPGSSRSSESG